MALLDSRWPKLEKAKTINQNDSKWLRSSFNNQTRGSLNKFGFFGVKYYNAKEIKFQHMSVKENISSNRKNRYEEINRFRNGDITRHLTSIDNEEIVRSGEFFVDFLDGFI